MASQAATPEDLTLHLPRILAFHGGGTNSAIFALQCRNLVKALQTSFRFCFVEAPHICARPGPDVMLAFNDMGPFKSWLYWRESSSLAERSETIDLIENAVRVAMQDDDASGADGPWVGLLGFSQGAKICASILAAQQHRSEVRHDPSWWPRFSFGVLLAGRGPLVALDEDIESAHGQVRASASPSPDCEHMPHKCLLRIPTLHVHGLQDPGLSLHREMLQQCCEAPHARLLEWPGTHMVPIKTVDVLRVAREILALATSSGVSLRRS